MSSQGKFYTSVLRHHEIRLEQLILYAGSVEKLLEYLGERNVYFDLCLVQQTIDGDPDENGVWDGSIAVVDNHFEYIGFDGPGGGTKKVSVRIEPYSIFYVC